MSELLEGSDFTSEGHKPFPSLYLDNDHAGDFSTWTTGALHERVEVYTDFILDSDLPLHRRAAARILNHLFFELDYRSK